MEVDKGIQRWFFNTSSWKPSPSQFSFCLSLLPPLHQHDVLKFIKFEDQKRALTSRLMQFMLIHILLEIQYSDVIVRRTREGKPYVGNSLDGTIFPNLNFSVSHHGDYVALASEPFCIVGLDIMVHDHTQGCEPIQEYISNFESCFTPLEWASLYSAGPEPSSLLNQFYRYWCLKEAYIKAVGIGLGFDLKRTEFYFTDGDIWSSVANVRVDGLERHDWCFHLDLLGNNHWVCVAKGPPEAAVESFKATLCKSELDISALAASLRRKDEHFLELSIDNLIPDVKREEFNILGKEGERFL